jgi:hypothetical protein
MPDSKPKQQLKVKSEEFKNSEEKQLSSQKINETADKGNLGFFKRILDFLKKSYNYLKESSSTIFGNKVASKSNEESRVIPEAKIEQKIESKAETKSSPKVETKSSPKVEAKGSSIKDRVFNFLSKVKKNPLVKILLSPLADRTMTLAFAATGITLGVLALSGVGIGAAAGFIAAPAIAIPLAVASIGTVAIAVGIDTLIVRRTRKLHNENKHLSRHRLAKDVQDKILAKDPKLAKALQGELYTPKREGKKSITNRLNSKKPSKLASLLPSVLVGGVQTIAKRVVPLTEAIITRNPLKILKVVALSAYGMSSVTSGNMTMSAKRDEFRNHIDKLRDKKDSPGYNNIKELKTSAREQKIQSLALQELVKDPAYPNYTDAQIREKFSGLKEKIQNTEKAVQSHYAITNIIKDLVIAHNPFSMYNDTEKLTTKLKSTELKVNASKKNILSKKITEVARKLGGKAINSKQKKKAVTSKNKAVIPKKKGVSRWR